MEQQAPAVLKLLAHDLRWALLQQLVRSDYRVAELVSQVEQPLNLVSYHLRLLRLAGLVRERRSTADERSFYYSLDLQRLHMLSLEPTGNLDSRTSVEIMAILQTLHRQGLTIILVTHEPDVAEYATRQIVFRDGHLVRDEPVAHPRDAQAEWAMLSRQHPDEYDENAM